jgi:hypothetical protein
MSPKRVLGIQNFVWFGGFSCQNLCSELGILIDNPNLLLSLLIGYLSIPNPIFFIIHYFFTKRSNPNAHVSFVNCIHLHRVIYRELKYYTGDGLIPFQPSDQN